MKDEKFRIWVENETVYAMLNYLRDKAEGLCEDKDETWSCLKKTYLEEARVDKDLVLTEEEMINIMKLTES